MKQHNLLDKGLSMSQAQSISNICNQKAIDIDRVINSINNSTKSFKQNGEEFILTNGVKMPENIKELLETKCMLYACQAFLMENIKAKDQLLDSERSSQYMSDIVAPELRNRIQFIGKPFVGEPWAWSQLTPKQNAEYIEAEANAAHLGQFIHTSSKLSKLRASLPNDENIEFMELQQGVKTPVKCTVHHTANQLNDLHQDIEMKHRKFNQRVNYFKAMVKNLVSDENARIEKINLDEQTRVSIENHKNDQENSVLNDEYRSRFDIASREFNIKKELEIKRISQLKIAIDERFQDVINALVKTIE